MGRVIDSKEIAIGRKVKQSNTSSEVIQANSDSQIDRKPPTDDKPRFKCKYCKATFRLKGGKTRHELIHTDKEFCSDERPYKCPKCSFHFKRYKTLKRHLKQNECFESAIGTKEKIHTVPKIQEFQKIFVSEGGVEENFAYKRASIPRSAKINRIKYLDNSSDSDEDEIEMFNESSVKVELGAENPLNIVQTMEQPAEIGPSIPSVKIERGAENSITSKKINRIKYLDSSSDSDENGFETFNESAVKIEREVEHPIGIVKPAEISQSIPSVKVEHETENPLGIVRIVNLPTVIGKSTPPAKVERETAHRVNLSTQMGQSKLKPAKKLKCDYCDIAINTEKALQRHLRTHTREKPFKCSYCPISFPTKFSLNRHERIHTGEKPYKCSNCPYRSSDPTHVSNHMKNSRACEKMRKKYEQKEAKANETGSQEKVSPPPPPPGVGQIKIEPNESEIDMNSISNQFESSEIMDGVEDIFVKEEPKFHFDDEHPMEATD